MLDNEVIHKIGPFTNKGDNWGTVGYWIEAKDPEMKERDDSFWLCDAEMVNLFPIIDTLSSFNILFWKNGSVTGEKLFIEGPGEASSLRVDQDGEIVEMDVNPEWVENVPVTFPWYVTLEPLSYVTYSDS